MSCLINEASLLLFVVLILARLLLL